MKNTEKTSYHVFCFSQLILCEAFQIHWCSMCLVCLDVEKASFAKLYVGHSKSPYWMQSEGRFPGMFLFLGPIVCGLRTWPFVFSVLMEVSSKTVPGVWVEMAEGAFILSMLVRPCLIRVCVYLPVTQNRSVALPVQCKWKKKKVHAEQILKFLLNFSLWCSFEDSTISFKNECQF